MPEGMYICAMLTFHIITLFPELFQSLIENGLIAKGIEDGEIAFRFVNPRGFTEDKHRTVDDMPYGGGGGMVMKAEPVVRAFESLNLSEKREILLPTPRGRLLTQSDLMRYTLYDDIVIICGRYKDIDQRAVEITGAEEISIGDYVLQGGEIPAMAIIEGVTRLLPDFIGEFSSAEGDSHWEDRGLSAPSYTRPRTFRGLDVPDVLLSGNHALIEKWREEEGKRLTGKRRPDILDITQR